MKKFTFNYLWLIPFLSAFILLIFHIFSIKWLNIDNTTLILLAILLISPLSLNIKKIKFGDFEAEINSEEVQKIAKDVNNAKVNINTDINDKLKDNLYEFNSITQDIKEVLKFDPILALAKLRMELEKSLNRIYDIYNLGNSELEKNSPIRIVKKISEHNILPNDIILPLRDVLSLCNRAIHGEDISKNNANTVVNSGTEILEMINDLIEVAKPIESKTISNEETDKYFNLKYRVITVTPYVENPQMNTYILTQDMLDNFLEGYNEFAEFIVEVQPINADYQDD